MFFADRIKETSTTTGTGNLTLAGAVAQFKSFASRFATNERFFYAIVGQTGTEWEVGEGEVSGTALIRSRIYASSNSDLVVSLSAGTKDVFCTHPGQFVNETPTFGEMLASIAGANMP